jgi:Cys-tRNA synthase (O-phospho-L-seryl-tRNA:Cys-tRNA synthase)
VQHGVTRNDEKGMLVQLQCEIFAARGQTCCAAIYVSDAQGSPLRDTDGSYSVGDHQVGVLTEMEPAFDHAVWKSLELFLPYNQIEVTGTGRHDLKFLVSVQVKNGDWIVLTSTKPQTFWVTR